MLSKDWLLLWLCIHGASRAVAAVLVWQQPLLQRKQDDRAAGCGAMPRWLRRLPLTVRMPHRQLASCQPSELPLMYVWSPAAPNGRNGAV